MLGKGTRRTAKHSRTAMIQAHGKDSTHGKEPRRTAKQAMHGKGLCRAYTAGRTAKNSLSFATLPCVYARERLCRVFFALCRVISMHGKELFSGSEREPSPGRRPCRETAGSHSSSSAVTVRPDPICPALLLHVSCTINRGRQFLS
jgi:hypothetical protein